MPDRSTLSWGRIVGIGLGCLVVLGLAANVYVQASEADIDFDGFHRAAAHVLDTGTLSRAEDVARYLPHFQALHIPFALLPVGIAAVGWLLISLIALAALPRELARLSGVTPRDQWPAWVAAAPFIWANLPLGQSGPVLLWLSIASVNAARDSSGARGGALVGLAALLKVPSAAMAAPSLLLGRPLRVAGGLLATLALGTALLVLAVGPDEALAGVARWIELIRTRQSPEGMVLYDQSLRFNNQSLPITLVRTFGVTGDLEIRGMTKLLELPRPAIWATVSAIVGALVLAGAACVVQAWRRGRDRESWLHVTALSALGLLFVSPLVWTHYFIWTLPALVALRASRRTCLLWCLVAVATLASQRARGLGVHLWMALALYVVLVWRFLRAPAPDSLPPGAEGS